jgi:hypothetical protein
MLHVCMMEGKLLFVFIGSSSIMYLRSNAVNKFLQIHIVVYLHVLYIQTDFVLLGVTSAQLLCLCKL